MKVKLSLKGASVVASALALIGLVLSKKQNIGHFLIALSAVNLLMGLILVVLTSSDSERV